MIVMGLAALFPLITGFAQPALALLPATGPTDPAELEAFMDGSIELGRLCNQYLQGGLHSIVYFGKFGNSHHVEDFFEMLGYTCDHYELIIFFDLRHQLNEQRNPAAVDVGILLDF